MDASSTISKSSEEDPIMKSDISKTSTEDYYSSDYVNDDDDDSSADASSTERGYRRCLQKFSKYLPDGELATQQKLRRKRDDEHDDIISKGGDGSGNTIEQFLDKKHKGAPDEGDYQPMEIVIKSQPTEAEDIRLEADEDFHRWVSPPDVSTLKDKTPKQTSNVLGNEDMNVVNNLLGADSDSDENNMGRAKGESQEDTSRVDDRIEGESNDIENQIDDKEATKSSDITPTETSTAPGLTSDVLENDDMETVNMMLVSTADDGSSDGDFAFRASYPNILFDNDNDAGKNGSSKKFDDEIDGSDRFMVSQVDEADDKTGSQTRSLGNTTFDEREGSSPNKKQKPTPGVEEGTPVNPDSDSGESSIPASDESTLSVPPRQNVNGVPQEGLTPIEEGATLITSPDLGEEDPMLEVVENDPWIRMMESRDMRIDHMDTDFLCLWSKSKPSLQTMNNVIGDSSFSEDETIQSQFNTSTPITPDSLLALDEENVMESKFLAAGNQIMAPQLKLQTRHIQGTGQNRQGSPPDIKSNNTREISPRNGSIASKNDNDRTFYSTKKNSDPRHESQPKNSIDRSRDTGTNLNQGSPATDEQLPSEGGDANSQSRAIEGSQHEQLPDADTSFLESNQSGTMRAPATGASAVDQSADFTQSVVSSNGWESTTSSSVYQDLENAGIASDDDGPPHVFSDDATPFNDEFDPLATSELTVVRGSRTKKNDSEAQVRERHDIAIGRSGNSGGKRRVSRAPAERGLSPRKMKVFAVLFGSFMLGAGTFWYIWHRYIKDDTEVQAAQAPSPGPAIQGTQTPTVTIRRTETPTWSPSWSPSQTKSPSEALRDLLVFAWPSLESDFANSSSPQSKALLWLQNSPGIDSYDSQQKIQRFVLATFFYSTDGAGWINKGSWLTNADECEWNLSNSFRPPCNEEGLYVYLELNSNGVSGFIPSELALLSNSLVRLELSQNGSGASVISGSIPPELGALTLLEVISLANNALAGELPNEIGQWTKATAIDVSGNALSSQLPPTIAALTSLRSLNLQRNSFTLLPRQIGGLLSLRNLDVSYNRLGNIPAEIGGLLSLRTLDISHNQIQSPIPSEIGLLSLRNLDISHNQIQSSIPSEIGRQSGLVYLDLSNNRLSGSIPIELSRATLLRNLALHNNGLMGTIPASFGALSRLATFRVEANDLTGIVSQNICNVFNESVPAFVSDCVIELDCPCCMFCCEDPGACHCQLEGELEFLCAEYSTTFGISSLGIKN